jgi:hypothetical protein
MDEYGWGREMAVISLNVNQIGSYRARLRARIKGY